MSAAQSFKKRLHLFGYQENEPVLGWFCVNVLTRVSDGVHYRHEPCKKIGQLSYLQ